MALGHLAFLLPVQNKVKIVNRGPALAERGNLRKIHTC